MKNVQIWCGVVVVCVVACFASCVKLGYLVKEAPSIEGASYVGTQKCLECHDEIGADFKKNIHNQLASFEVKGPAKGCETCHGAGSLHLENVEEAKNILRFGKLTADQSSAVCLNCHNDPAKPWTSSVHIAQDLSCMSCHKIHKAKEKRLLKTKEVDLCYTCHREKQAQMNFPSHHPLREGKMKCSSCHNAHSPDKEFTTQGTVNDLCYNCHAEYQGPFVFEHAPVSDDCGICHDPHGTVANNLLKQNQPYLCLRCHQGHNPNVEQSAQGGTAHTRQATFLTACTQCHSTIHGTDLPSRATGEGHFTR